MSAVQTGLDLLRVVDMELNNQPGDHVAVVKNGSVRRVTVAQPPTSPTYPPENMLTQIAPPGYEYMYVFDLDFPHHYRVLFAGAY